jgi:pseudouridine-5'-phosphate glycosidase
VPEADEIAAHDMRGFIDTAVREAQEYGVQGKAVTPYILARIVALSGGRSLRTNIALAKNNARVAAEIAVAMHS